MSYPRCRKIRKASIIKAENGQAKAYRKKLFYCRMEICDLTQRPEKSTAFKNKLFIRDRNLMVKAQPSRRGQALRITVSMKICRRQRNTGILINRRFLCLQHYFKDLSHLYLRLTRHRYNSILQPASTRQG